MTATARVRASFLVLAALVSASCTPSKHPLSDETTSVVDEALIGEWSLNFEGDDGQELKLSNLFIGRKDTSKNTLEVAVDIPRRRAAASKSIASIYSRRVSATCA